ncbi:MAG TPA: molybdopterin-guanine dinucleotide biosynthesis protein B [Methanoregula sp.]|mgnify:CR=1 FL=1|nr:molybdopterin-guanine dinucleotide biosynthesis protein B [Methanoregula sp.]
MKIIQVSGRANTGKTTFIRKLIPLLKSRGRVGVIKHLGDHEFLLEEGKDTTLFFDDGADVSVGIDSTKSVIAIHTDNLDNILHFLKNDGVDFAVIEGFKQRKFPKIIIGDLPSDTCVLRNPTVEQVISSLSLFEDY